MMTMRLTVPALLLALAVTGCGSDDPTPTGPDTSVVPEKIETFAGTAGDDANPPLTVNGARTHPFVVERVGSVTARLTSLSPNNENNDLRIGLSLGTWNGIVCQIILANDNATTGATSSVIGTASTTGNFCVRVYDVGRLTTATDYVVTVTHF